MKSQSMKITTSALGLVCLLALPSAKAVSKKIESESTTDLIISVYNPDAGSALGNPSVMVIRDGKNDTLNLKACSEVFQPSSEDARIISQQVLAFEASCVPYEDLQSTTYSYNVFKNYIGVNDDGKPKRAVYTGAGLVNTKRDPEVLKSDVATWTINTLAGGALSTGDLILLVGARVTNEKTENPQISSYRQTFVLVGSGLRVGKEIPRM